MKLRGIVDRIKEAIPVKMRIVIAALVLLGGGVLIARSVGDDRDYVGSGIEHVQWSQDGRYLFYSKSQNRLFRYDVETGEPRTYDIPDRLDVFSVSPDGKQVMFPATRNDTYGIYVMSLDSRAHKHIPFPDSVERRSRREDSGKQRVFHVILKGIRSIDWISDDYALLLVKPEKGYEAVYRLDIVRGDYTVVQPGIEDFSWTTDGSGFIYLRPDGRFYFHNLAEKTTKRLDFKGMTDTSRTGFLYASKHQIVITYRESDYVDYRGYVLDLRTMDMKPIDIPQAEAIAGISPRLDKCLVGSVSRPDAFRGWVGNKVYVTDLPAAMARELRRLEAR